MAAGKGLVLSMWVAAAAAAAPAHAAVYTGNWDPAYGAPFPDVGWRGSATFSIPDTCVVAATQVYSFDCLASPGMQVLGAQVEIYKLSDNSVVETLLFNSKPTVYSMTFDSALNLTAASTAFFDPLKATSSFDSLSDYAFHLDFDGKGAQLFHTNWKRGFANPICAYQTTDRTACGFSFDTRTPTGSSPFTFVTVQAPVPEPQTYVLMLAGLAALTGLLKRRRRSQQPA